MGQKFNKNRSVPTWYLNIPLYYTGIKHPHNQDKELVILNKMGRSYQVAWKNYTSFGMGMTFLVKATEKGFIFKDKEYALGNIVL